MRVKMLFATFVLCVATSVSAQVMTPLSQPAGSVADLLSRAARMAAAPARTKLRRDSLRAEAIAEAP